MLKNLVTAAALLLSLTVVVLSLMPQIDVPVEVMSGIHISLAAYAVYFVKYEEF